MDKEKIKFGIILFATLFATIFGICTLCSPLFLTITPAEDNIIIDGDNVVSYNISNEDEIEIIMNDGTIYTVKLGFNDEVVDFTVSSDIHIELERFDTRAFWWDFIISTEPNFPDEYRIGRIIKLPDSGGK